MRNEMMCPSCGSAIHPTLFECLPAYSRKQYKCPRCGAWITLDGRSRFIMFVVYISVFNAVLWPMFLYKDELRRALPLEQHVFGILVASLPVIASAVATLLLLKRIAGWVVAPKSDWDFPSWTRQGK